MTDTPATTSVENPVASMSLDHFLDMLPIFATIVTGGQRMRGASDEALQAWGWGIEDTQNNIRRLIAEWRTANDAK